jgi:hypothetical protein
MARLQQTPQIGRRIAPTRPGRPHVYCSC